MTGVIESDHVMFALCNLTGSFSYLSFFDRRFTIVCRHRPTRKPCCGRVTVRGYMYDAVVKLDTNRNLQRRGIVRFSCDSTACLYTNLLLTMSCLLLLQAIDLYYLDKNLLGWQVCFHVLITLCKYRQWFIKKRYHTWVLILKEQQ